MQTGTAATPLHPQARPVHPSSIPQDLQNLRHWVCWRYEPRADGRIAKVPYQPAAGSDGAFLRADTTKPSTWHTFDQVVRAYSDPSSGLDGIGFVFMPPLVGVDLDNAIDHRGQVKPWAKVILDSLQSYTEYSPSGTGIHIICAASLDSDKGHRAPLGDGGIEVYTQGRYFTMTGHRLPPQPVEVNDCTPQLQALLATFPSQAPQAAGAGTSTGGGLDDQAVLAALFAGKGGDKLQRLWNGEMSDFGDDHSRCDQALCNALAFYTSDPAQIDRLFHQSGMMRPKWDRDDYRQATIDKALQQRGKGYQPSQRDPAAVAAAQAAIGLTAAPQQGTAGTNGAGHTSTPHMATNGATGATTAPQGASAAQPGTTTGPAASAPYHNTDAGNALRLVKLHGDSIRYVFDWGAWYVWDGRRWAEDRTRHVERLAKQTVRSIYLDAANEPDPYRSRELGAWALRSEGQDRIAAMVRSAQSEPGITIPHDLLDQHPWLLNVRNGIINLQTGALVPHDRALLITRLIDVDYDPAALCPQWLAFLHKVQQGDQDTIRFLRRAVGYSLTGSTREHVMLFLYGTGANGKSTFIETLLRLFGEYATKLPAETLMARHDDTGTGNGIAQLAGKRLAITSETERNRQLADSRVKNLTGGDTISARYLYQEQFEFRPTHTLWMYGNHKPIIKGTDDGIWRRIRLVPFTVTIAEGERDPQLAEKLQGELPGILAWAVHGCLEWQQSGLGAPSAVAAATADYRADMDSLKAFLDDECITGKNPQTGRPYEVPLQQLYGAYEAWCKVNGETPLTKPTFGRALDERGFVASRGHSNKSTRLGIALQAVAATAGMVNP